MEQVSPQDVDACLRVLARAANDPADPALAPVRRAVDLAYRSVKKQRRTARRADRREHDLALVTTAARYREEIPPTRAVRSAERASQRGTSEERSAAERAELAQRAPGTAERASQRGTSEERSTAERAELAQRAPGTAERASQRGTSEERSAAERASGTAGAPHHSAQSPAAALRGSRPCYVCKAAYRRVDAEYHMLCPDCAARNSQRRQARCDLTGRRALLTGGRVKIGFHTALKLLRDGAEVLVTTRFPHDAARRFAAVPDSPEWTDRLWIHGVDFLDLSGVLGLVEAVRERWGALDILINNAAQTIARPAEYHREVRAAESAPLRGREAAIALTGAAPRASGAIGGPGGVGTDLAGWFPAGERDETGEPLDLRPSNSWVLRVDEVSPREWLEVHVVNAFVPFLLTARVKPLLLRSCFPDRYVVQVSAMEGSFARERKTARHPHTNMAKAGLNMLTRTVAEEYAAEGIYMTSVDTGWVTDERPHASRREQRTAGFRPPLDVIDGAARVYDPIVRGIGGEPVYGVFLKDYGPVPW